MPCTIVIRDLVGIGTDGDGERDRLVVVGTVGDCAALTVSVNTATVPAEVLPPDESAFGVAPASAERVFLGRFELTDTAVFEGECGTPLLLTVTVECTAADAVVAAGQRDVAGVLFRVAQDCEASLGHPGQLLLGHGVSSVVGDPECQPSPSVPYLAEVQARLLAFQHRYEQTATPFDWHFTRSDLDRLLRRLDDHEPVALAA